jgi:hypothetical protein
MKRIQIELWWIWQSQEEVWVDLFRRNMKDLLLQKTWIKIDDTSTRFKSKIRLDNWKMLECLNPLIDFNPNPIININLI